MTQRWISALVLSASGLCSRADVTFVQKTIDVDNESFGLQTAQVEPQNAASERETNTTSELEAKMSTQEVAAVEREILIGTTERAPWWDVWDEDNGADGWSQLGGSNRWDDLYTTTPLVPEVTTSEVETTTFEPETTTSEGESTTAELTDSTTTTTTSCETETASCEIYNDPHVSGFNNGEDDGPSSLGHKSFAQSLGFDGNPVYFSAGDFWLVKSNLLQIQGRYLNSTVFKEGGAVVGAIAIGGPILDGKVLLVEPRDGRVTWDRRNVSLGTSESIVSSGQVLIENGVRVYGVSRRPYSRLEIYLPKNTEVTINRYDAYLNVKITMPVERTGRIDGQCGNFNGDLEDDSSARIERRMGGLAVLPEDSLFLHKYPGKH